MVIKYFVVDGWRDGRLAGQWVIAATDVDEACTIAERRHAGIADFDSFNAEDASDLFDAEENLTEKPIVLG
jgi:hypothetical protein